ncbi:pseudaminic acid cytidylyltransferase [Tenacibaculum sp. HL-MS23]|uniref:pseudaminic acid cytidylyltransferase n=1 Tax=unclassified Tenacibaculum TaxID=2635139 RepID=UPI001C4F51F8|nr:MULTISPECIES: pseudaminic acid cytidylyltransferase [unclassified Tenacibaculum]QXP73886.1 pseudaminic acid cytidylyltransferase [Tenacibaculum sp. AHE14PA]QXP75747.1 pseudaminic acid cytidylyltransferase [Tenacibaculum sp. AHE15PA]WNW02306.1 pseudaminic acid cytidylyltransferase [Tenacibaculum sp. HL-MS23]
MSRIAIIPARGGSKRIPKKNIKTFLGEPIIAYSIEAAINSNLFDEVIVSTDDDEIAKIAKQYGATIPFKRSKKNSNDFATTFDVINEVLNWYKKENTFIETACCIYATAPFVTSDLLINAHQQLVANNFDTVFPAIRFGFPIQRALKVLDENGKMEMFQPEHLNSRSQDLEVAYHDVGQFYFFKPETALEKGKLWTDNSGIIEINELNAQDIDTETDWKLAEIKYQLALEK